LSQPIQFFLQEILIQIKFLINVSPIFEGFLNFFQKDVPLVHLLYSELLSLMMTLLKRFVKASAVDGLTAKELLKLDVTSTEIQLPETEMDFGLETKREVRCLFLYLCFRLRIFKW